jgi:hypothetical protein
VLVSNVAKIIKKLRRCFIVAPPNYLFSVGLMW